MYHAQQAKNQAFGQGIAGAQNLSDHMVIDQDDQDEIDPTKKKYKAKRFRGLLEWVLEQEGHEFLVDVDRKFIKNQENLVGIMEKMKQEMS